MTTRKAQSTTGINTYKLAAVAAQGGSFWASYLLVAALFGAGLASFGGALLFEFVLMKGKQLLFSGKDKTNSTGWACIVVDTIVNAAGLWTGILNFDDTQVWTMLQQGLGIQGDMAGIPALLVALAAGFILSIAPHSLWRD
jgi:hypothetical protein